jgi:hypothetical protein
MDETPHDKVPARMHEPKNAVPLSGPRSAPHATQPPPIPKGQAGGAPLVIESSRVRDGEDRVGDDDPTRLVVRDERKGGGGGGGDGEQTARAKPVKPGKSTDAEPTLDERLPDDDVVDPPAPAPALPTSKVPALRREGPVIGKSIADRKGGGAGASGKRSPVLLISLIVLLLCAGGFAALYFLHVI